MKLCCSQCRLTPLTDGCFSAVRRWISPSQTATAQALLSPRLLLASMAYNSSSVAIMLGLLGRVTTQKQWCLFTLLIRTAAILNLLGMPCASHAGAAQVGGPEAQAPSARSCGGRGTSLQGSKCLCSAPGSKALVAHSPSDGSVSLICCYPLCCLSFHLFFTSGFFPPLPLFSSYCPYLVRPYYLLLSTKASNLWQHLVFGWTWTEHISSIFCMFFFFYVRF